MAKNTAISNSLNEVENNLIMEKKGIFLPVLNNKKKLKK